VPAAQSTHLELLLLPDVSGLYFPAGHFLHALAPDSLEYLPASHPIHVAEPFKAEKVPASQSVQLLASLPENFPVPHCKQEVMFVAFE